MRNWLYQSLIQRCVLRMDLSPRIQRIDRDHQHCHECRQHSRKPEDAIATATLLTAKSIRIALEKFVRSAIPRGDIQLVLSGGGARNKSLVRMLREQTSDLGCTLRTSD